MMCLYYKLFCYIIKEVKKKYFSIKIQLKIKKCSIYFFYHHLNRLPFKFVDQVDILNLRYLILITMI